MGDSRSENAITSASDMDDEVMDTSHVLNHQPVNISQSQRKIWLVKLPDFLMERWSSMSKNWTEGIDFGTVRIYEQLPNKQVQVSMHLSNDPRLSDLPKDYDLSFVRNAKPNSAFSEKEGNNHSLEIEGKIEQECLVKPIINDTYKQLVKERNVKSNQPKRTIQYLDQERTDVKYGVLAPVSENILLTKKKQKFSSEHKRERLPRAELLDLLFTAFEKYPRWTLKGLVNYSKQPVVYLKELLNEISVYNKRGPFKNTFELKPEYQASAARSEIVERFNIQEEEFDQDLSEDEAFTKV